MKQLIYLSQPFGFDDAMLSGILVQARRNNARDDITGALICRRDIYLQLVEGPADAIDALFARIAEDDRHQDVARLWDGEVAERMFPDWEMLDDPARSWLWSAEAVAAGAATRATGGDLRAIFERVAREVAAG